MNKPLLVVIGYVWPEPNSSAAGSRMLGILNAFLAREWCVVFASAAALSPHRFDLPSIGIQEKSIELNSSSFDEWLSEINPQAVMFDRFFTEEQFGWRVARTCPNAIRLLDTEDLHSLRAARHSVLKDSSLIVGQQAGEPVSTVINAIHPIMAEMEITQRELSAIYRCDLTIMISRVEIQLLHEKFLVPQVLLAYLPLGVEQLPSPKNELGFEERRHLVVIGNFRHEPNWDAVLYLKQTLWPRICQLLKQQGEAECELHIYGAYPPPKATQLHQPKEKFLVKGWADSAFDVLSASRVCLAPLRFGAGQKGKLLDAMLTGTPSVTTPVGSESMCPAEFNWPGIVAEDSEGFCNAVVSLYTDSSAWTKAQEAIRPLLTSEFLLGPYWDQLFESINALSTDLAGHRLANPIGRLLQLNANKSTEYMGQWIEAKTKLAAALNHSQNQ